MVTDLNRLGQVAAIAVMIMTAGCGIRPDQLAPPTEKGQDFPAQYPRQ
jgi:hypothetical protein